MLQTCDNVRESNQDGTGVQSMCLLIVLFEQAYSMARHGSCFRMKNAR